MLHQQLQEVLCGVVAVEDAAGKRGPLFVPEAAQRDRSEIVCRAVAQTWILVTLRLGEGEAVIT